VLIVINLWLIAYLNLSFSDSSLPLVGDWFTHKIQKVYAHLQVPGEMRIAKIIFIMLFLLINL